MSGARPAKKLATAVPAAPGGVQGDPGGGGGPLAIVFQRVSLGYPKLWSSSVGVIRRRRQLSHAGSEAIAAMGRWMLASIKTNLSMHKHSWRGGVNKLKIKKVT